MAYRLAPFLERYDTILFDMDGVITSEEVYWDAAALTVWEMLKSNRYFGNEEMHPKSWMEQIPAIRKKVFCEDKTIKLVKNRGVNSNWDLAYLVLGAALINDTDDDFEAIYGYLKDLGQDAFEMYEIMGEKLHEKLQKPIEYTARLAPFWKSCTYCFQEWFLGDELFPSEWGQACVQLGKKGLMYDEHPIVDKEKLVTLLSLLQKAGKRLGIGTGRPRVEIQGVLKSWDIAQFFQADAMIDYNHVTDAEKVLRKENPELALTKPHPFMFLKGMLGSEVKDEDIVADKYDSSLCKRTLIVGDAGADMYAAFACDCDFAAVLTGVQKKAARSFFEKENAAYILDDVLRLMEEEQTTERIVL